jgi:guanylate kinase
LRLLTEYPERFQASISHTTRAPRLGEIDGVSYHFVSDEVFLELVATDKTVIYERDSRGVLAMAKFVRGGDGVC